MLDNLLLHPQTRSKLDDFIKNSSHALLLLGQKGSGKHTVAQNVAAQLLSTGFDSLEVHPNFISLQIPKDKKEIPIEQVRELTHTLRLKVISKKQVNRVVYIENASTLTGEAQNALLKLLEEPPAGTVFILTASSVRSVLPTIASRTTKITIQPIGLSEAQHYFSQVPKSDLASSLVLSQGGAGLLSNLVTGEETPLRTSIDRAKAFLSKTPYERFVELDSFSKDKVGLADFLESLSTILKALYRSSATKSKNNQVKKLIKAAQTVAEAKEELELNVTTRLVIIKLALNLNI